MRILHLLPHLSGGGAERQFSYLAPELVRMGHSVHVAYLSEGPMGPALAGVTLHPLVARNNYDPYLFWQIFRLMRQIKPDIIHTWILQMDILGGIAASFNRIPWILREPCSAIAYPWAWKFHLRILIGSMSNAIVSNSSGGDEYWKTRLPYSHRYIIPNAVLVDEIDDNITNIPLVSKMPESPIILHAGRLADAQKRPKAFLEVLSYVRQQENFVGILCGEGSQRSELELLKHKFGLDDNVNFTGNIPGKTLWALMKKASVFVSLSAYEGCPNTVMEAMACGCPLVVSDIPAHREILDESCALFVDPVNIQQTANTIVWALKHSESLRNQVEIAKRKTQEWSITKMACNYEKIYDDVIFRSTAT